MRIVNLSPILGASLAPRAIPSFRVGSQRPAPAIALLGIRVEAAVPFEALHPLPSSRRITLSRGLPTPFGASASA